MNNLADRITFPFSRSTRAYKPHLLLLEYHFWNVEVNNGRFFAAIAWVENSTGAEPLRQSGITAKLRSHPHANAAASFKGIRQA
jgi:hypothetical protein